MDNDYTRIENGLRQFHKLPQDRRPTWVERNDGQKQAYLWCFPEGHVVTYAAGAQADVKALLKTFDLQHHNYDREYIMVSSHLVAATQDSFRCCVLDSKDCTHWVTFIAQCSKADLEQGQIKLEDALVVGAFKDGELVAAASIWQLPCDLADIGILVHPQFRGHGLGAITVRFLIDQINAGYTPIYRADYLNTASWHLAEKLGFTLFTRIYRLL